MKYKVLLLPWEDGTGYTAEVVSLPGCITEGSTREEALALAREAAELWIETAMETNREVPVEPGGTEVGEIDVDVPVPANT